MVEELLLWVPEWKVGTDIPELHGLGAGASLHWLKGHECSGFRNVGASFFNCWYPEMDYSGGNWQGPHVRSFIYLTVCFSRKLVSNIPLQPSRPCHPQASESFEILISWESKAIPMTTWVWLSHKATTEKNPGNTYKWDEVVLTSQ